MVVQVLGEISAPRLGAAPPWTLTVVDVNFDYVEETLEVLERRPALRGKLRPLSEALSAKRLTGFAAAGVAATADWRSLIPPNVYRSW